MRINEAIVGFQNIDINVGPNFIKQANRYRYHFRNVINLNMS